MTAATQQSVLDPSLRPLLPPELGQTSNGSKQELFWMQQLLSMADLALLLMGGLSASRVPG
jgi:hypothetical protein